MRHFRLVIRSVFGFIAGLHCQPFFALALLCLLLQEQFPFSNFPMYSSFTNKTFYVHLADDADQPVSTFARAGMHTSKLKKIYESELRKESQSLGNPRSKLTPVEKRPAGERVLTMLRESAGSRFPAVLRLYEVNISLAGGRFEKQSLLIAEAR